MSRSHSLPCITITTNIDHESLAGEVTCEITLEITPPDNSVGYRGQADIVSVQAISATFYNGPHSAVVVFDPRRQQQVSEMVDAFLQTNDAERERIEQLAWQQAEGRAAA